MIPNPEANKHFFNKKNRNAVKKQERFEKSKKYQKECEVSLKLQEEFLRGAENGKTKE